MKPILIDERVELRATDDVKTGGAHKFMRLHDGTAAYRVAELMGFTAQYICDLEQGRRPWTGELSIAYQKALQEASRRNGAKRRGKK